MFISIVGLVTSVLWGGFVLSKLWVWFIVTLGVGIQPITVLQAIGLTIVADAALGSRGLVADMAVADKAGEDQLFHTVFWTLFYPALALGLGWIVHSFM